MVQRAVDDQCGLRSMNRHRDVSRGVLVHVQGDVGRQRRWIHHISRGHVLERANAGKEAANSSFSLSVVDGDRSHLDGDEVDVLKTSRLREQISAKRIHYQLKIPGR